MVLLRLSWGNTSDVKKARIYAHHVPETEGDAFWKLVMERLGEMAEIDE